MKKLVFIMPLMVMSLLASCGGSNPEPTPEMTYTITFKNEGDEDKKIENIKAGSIITDIPSPITPKPDSSFIGWCTDTESKNVFDFSKIKIYQDYTLYSGWNVNKPTTYTVLWVNDDGTILQADQVADGDVPPKYKGDTPIKKSDAFCDYSFSKFSPDIKTVHSNQVYIANYTVTKSYVNTKVFMGINIEEDVKTYNFNCSASSNITIDWDDGNPAEEVAAGNMTHNYSEAGEYNIRIYGEITGINLKDNTMVERVYLGDTITSINNYAFDNCLNLTSVELTSVTSIGMFAFYSCSSLVSINTNTVTDIGFEVFGGCSNLTSITISSGVTNINDAFVGCSNLVTIKVDTANKIYTSQDASGKECNAIITKDGKTLVTGCKGTTIPNSVTTIGENAFNGSGLTSIAIPNSVTTISDIAFRDCSSLVSVKLSNGLTSIGSSAFAHCSSLISIAIPSSVTEFGWGVFYHASSLKIVDLTAYTTDSVIPTLIGNDFDYCHSELKLYVTDKMVDSFKKAPGWSEYADKITDEPIPLLQCSQLQHYCKGTL